MKITVDIHDESTDEIVVESLLAALDLKFLWELENEPTLEQSIKEVLKFYGKETS